MSLKDLIRHEIVAGMCQEDFIERNDAYTEKLNSLTNEELLNLISDALSYLPEEYNDT